MMKTEYGRIILAAEAAGKQMPVMRFATREEYEEWKEAEYQKLVKLFAPKEGEEWDDNARGDKFAVVFSDIYTYEREKIRSIPYIIGDFATVEEYRYHVAKRFNEELDAWARESWGEDTEGETEE